jgi:hypothetical protein
LQDNRFDARGGVNGDYGARANADLIVTRGAGFRKEKNKKKKGSYKGGIITVGGISRLHATTAAHMEAQMESHAIKFMD